MTKLLDSVFEFCASLKLAIFVILSLAFYLGSATVYEARYGTRAVQDIIYNSTPFVLLMCALSINVMAAVLVRYPWKRKQTGFIITHVGIEVLLLGCLISFRYSVDGKVSLTPGQKSEVINLNDEEVGVNIADASGKLRRHVFPINLWKDAGYPGLAKFVGGSLEKMLPGDHHLINLPEEASWPQGHAVSWPMGDGAKLEVLEWLPAAVSEEVLKPVSDGFPAAMIHLGGSLPNGGPMDQDVPIVADGTGKGMVRPFGGTMEMDLWKARSADEVNEFLHPPKRADLPEMGRLAIYLGGKRYPVDVTKESLNKDAPLGDSGYKVAVIEYVLTPEPPQLPENHGQSAIASQPVNPEVHLRITGPQGVRKYLVAAWYPGFIARDDDGAGQHGAAKADDPLIYYAHPQAYFTTKTGTRGRLQLLQSLDGKLYGRIFELEQTANQQPVDPFEVQVGKTLEHAWLKITIAITQHYPSGMLVDQFRQAHVEPRQMDQHSRAIKVALTVDGQRQEAWLELGEGAPTQLNTPRGPVTVDYSYSEHELGFSVGLNHAEQTNDPGSDSAAAYSSNVAIAGAGKNDGDHTISMNEPITVNHLTFYQAGFAEVPDGQGGAVAFTTLSVRNDPGWMIKYLGCALIVGGIFTMFYMKAYFQKSVGVGVKALPPGGTVVRPPSLNDKSGTNKSGKPQSNKGLPAVTSRSSSGAPKTT